MSILNNNEIPIGLGMALAKNLNAMQIFASLDDVSRDSVIQRSHLANSKQDMESIVSDLLK